MAVPGPARSILTDSLPRVDYLDAYATTVPPGATADPEAWAAAIFDAPPPWVRTLLKVRNRAVAPLGLKTPSPDDNSNDSRPLTFPLLLRTDDEVLLGLDDRHLDFRVSVMVRDGMVTASTAVYLHSSLGRAYFAPVRLIHPIVMRALVRRARPA